MKKWMKQLNRVLVLTLVAVCLFAGLRVTVHAAQWIQEANGKWWYKHDDGSYTTNGWEKIDGSWYYFDGSGYMVTNSWVDGGNCYVGSDGKMYANKWDPTGVYYCGSEGYYLKNAWVPVVNGAPDKTAYVDENGKKVKSSWKTIGGYTYYFGADGIYDTGFQKIGGVWYYLGTGGRKETGWVTLNGETFYLNPSSNPSGAMVTGWKTISNKDYYFNSNGVLQKNKTIDGYYVGPNGHKHTGWVGTTYYNVGKALTKRLTIKNSVTGQTGKQFTITVNYNMNGTTGSKSFTLAHNGSGYIDLPYSSTYTVTQGGVTGYSTSGTFTSAKSLTADTTVTVTNTLQTQTLTVTNTVKGADVTCTYTLNATYADGSAHTSNKTFTLTNGKSASFTLPKSGKYTVTQVAVSGYTTTGGASNATLSANATVAFTNTQQLKLTVKKAVSGGTARADKDYAFTVKLGSNTYTFNLKKDGTWTSGNFAYGTSYSVTETDYSGQGFTTNNRTASGTLTTNATVTVTNTQQQNTLTVTNATLGTAAGEGTQFTYTLNVTYADGTAFISNQTFTLGDDGSKSFTLPRNSTYTVTQTANTDFRTGVSGGSGTVTGDVTAAFTNTELLDLTVTKLVAGDTARADKEYGFTLTYTEPGAQSAATETFSLVKDGAKTVTLPYNTAYSLEEADYTEDGYTAAYTGAWEGNLTADTPLTVTNTQEENTLTVTNTIIGTEAGQAEEFAYTLTVTYADGFPYRTNEPFTLGDEGAATFTLPKNAAYTVTQTGKDNFRTEVTGSSGTVTGDVTAGFTNTELLALTVTKLVVGDTARADKTYDFTLTYTEPGEESSATETFSLLKDETKTVVLPYNTAYSLAERDYTGEGYTTEYTGTREGALTAAAGVTVTNTQLANTLTVTNAVTGTDTAKATTFTYTLDVTYADGAPYITRQFTLADGETQSFTLPQNVSYTLEQTADESFHTYKTDSGNGNLAEDSTVAFTNTELLELTVTNVVAGELARADKTFEITVTYTEPGAQEPTGKVLSLANGESRTVTLPYGAAYSVTEENYAAQGYTTTYTDNREGSLTADTAVTVTNTQEARTLTVTNTVTGGEGAGETAFVYTLTVTYADGISFPVEGSEFTLADGGSKEFTLPKNAVYTVEQTAVEGFYTYKTDSCGGDLETDATVAFTSVELLELQVELQVSGDLAQADRTYEVYVTYTKPGETEATVDTAILADGGSAVYTLPYGTVYTVTEKDYSREGYSIAGDVPAETTLVEDAAVMLTNTQEEQTLTVRKIVNSTEDPPVTYTVNVAYANGDPFITNETFSLANGEEKTFILPRNAIYTAQQTEAEGFRTDMTDTGEGKLDNDSVVTFTNTQQIILRVENVVSGEDRPIPFTVALTWDGAPLEAENITGPDTVADAVLTDGVYTLQLRDQEFMEFTVPYGAGYTVTAVKDSLEVVYKTLITGADETDGCTAAGTAQGETVTFTNLQMASVTVSNTVIGRDQPFTFTVALTAGAEAVEKSADTIVLEVLENVGYSVALRSGESVTFTVPYGTGYAVTQTALSGYRTTVAGGENTAVEGTAEGDAVVAGFTNTQMLTLTLSNKVGGLGSRSKVFTFVLQFGDGSEYTLELTDGQSATYDVPWGTAYRIQQISDYSAEGYVTQYKVLCGADSTAWIEGMVVTGYVDGLLPDENSGIALAEAGDEGEKETDAAENESVIFDNSIPYVIPTGVALNGLPFLAMLLLGGAMGAYMILDGGRKSRRER